MFLKHGHRESVCLCVSGSSIQNKETCVDLHRIVPTKNCKVLLLRNIYIEFWRKVIHHVYTSIVVELDLFIN